VGRMLIPTPVPKVSAPKGASTPDQILSYLDTLVALNDGVTSSLDRMETSADLLLLGGDTTLAELLLEQAQDEFVSIRNDLRRVPTPQEFLDVEEPLDRALGKFASSAGYMLVAIRSGEGENSIYWSRAERDMNEGAALVEEATRALNTIFR
jgi:hypothetical protein